MHDCNIHKEERKGWKMRRGFKIGKRMLREVVSNRWTGLWTGSLDWTAGLDCWTGLLDWITGLTFELKLCVSHDLHPITCGELGHMFDA